MKKISLLLTLLSLICLDLKADDLSLYALQPGHDYYIWNSYYGRPIGPSSDQSQPRLVVYNADNDAQYLFTAEEAPTGGYVLLKHKATGKYMAASTSNSYSTVFQASVGTGDAYQWRVRPGWKGELINKHNTSTALGVDTGETKDEIGIWYDKVQEVSTTMFQVFESDGNGLESSRKTSAVRELKNLSSYIEGELNDTKYPLLARNKMPKSLAVVNAWIVNPESKTYEEMMQKDSILRDSLGWMTSYESTVLLTSTDMDSYGSTFSLALKELELNTETYPEDSIYVLLRNTEGLGTRYTIRESGDYVFVYQDAKVKVYQSGTLLETLPTCFLPEISAQGTDAEWTIVRKSRVTSSLPEVLSETSAVTEGGGITVDKYGNNTRTVVSLTKVNLTLDSQIDFHILSESAPLTNCTINLANEKAWLILDNVRPSEVISSYLSQIKINGAAAQNKTNCRVVIYLNGALVMPYNASDKVFQGYEGEQYSGTELGYIVGAHSNLGKNSNKIRSFRLKRGYMATLASGTAGSGYSRVYVADHEDLEVPVLPSALYGRISSIVVKKWSYVSKKGYCSTKSTDNITSEGKKIRSTWFYTWGADRSSTTDMEYVPIRSHIWWPSMSAITNQDATACLSFNEPEHSEQHDDCDCGGTISEWSACTYTPDFQQTGMRIGSPAPTADSWLTTYITDCNNMAYRCDFVAIHAYWGSNECNDGNAWYTRLKAIYNATKRPIWITEWAYGASWTTESWPSGWSDKLEQNRWRVKDIQKKLEEAPFVERYAYYEWDTQFRNLCDWSTGAITPAGKVYRDMKSDFAYNADYQFTPVWWEPSKKSISMIAQVNAADQTLAVTVINTNQDVTDILAIQKLNQETGLWESYYTESDRSKFDSDTIRLSFPKADFDVYNDQLRAYVKRLINNGDEAYSMPVCIYNDRVMSYSYRIANSDCENSNTTGWTVTNTSTNTGEACDGSSSNAYFNQWKASAFTSTMTQTISNLPKGKYTLGALLRCNTGTKLTLEAKNGDTATQATITPSGNVSQDGDTFQNGWKQCYCDPVILESGDNLTITLTANVNAGGWWSADHFTLKWESTDPDAIESASVEVPENIYDLQGRKINKTGHGLYIVNGKKVIR